MLEEKLLDLVVRLHKKTTEKKLDWEESEFGKEVYETTLGAFKVRIKSRWDPDYPEQPDYIVQLVGENEKVLEEFSNATFRGIEPHPYRLMEETYTVARRRALGVEAALESVLDDLGKDN